MVEEERKGLKKEGSKEQMTKGRKQGIIEEKMKGRNIYWKKGIKEGKE